MSLLRKDNYNIGRINIIFILFFLIVSADTVMFGTNIYTFYLSIRKVFTVLLIPLTILACYSDHERKKDNRVMTIGFIMSALVLFSATIHSEIGPQTLMRVSLVISGFIYVSMTPLRKFMIAYEKACYFLVIIALIVYAIAFFAPQLLSLSLNLENVNNYSYNNFILAVVSEKHLRLQGPFREPGVCGLFFSYALLFYFQYIAKLDYKRVTLYVTAIVLTSSTTSLLMLPFIFLFYFMSKKGTESSKSTYILIILFSIAAVGLFLYTDLFASDGVLLSKLSDENNLSRLSRLSSVFTSLEIIRGNPIFGVGVEGASQQFTLMNMQQYGETIVDNTNLYLSYAVVYGVPYALYATLGIYYFCKYQSSRLFVRLLFIIPAMLLFFGETLFENLFVFIIIAYGFKLKKYGYYIS